MLAAVKNMDTDARRPPSSTGSRRRSPQVDPRKLTRLRGQGPTGYAGAASVVLPDVAQARRLGNDARTDGTLDHGC